MGLTIKQNKYKEKDEWGYGGSLDGYLYRIGGLRGVRTELRGKSQMGLRGIVNR